MGFPNRAQSLAQWIGRCLGDTEKTKADGTTQAGMTHFALMHLNGMAEKELDVIKVQGKTFNGDGETKLADRILGVAETDAQGLSGKQKYIVYAFWEEDREPRSRHFININGHIVNDLGDHSTEPPTNEGRTQQRMRHDEAYSQILITSNANLINQQNAFIERISIRAENAEKQNMEMLIAFKELMMREMQNDHRLKMEAAAFERNTILMTNLAKLLPMIANTVSGKEMFPQSAADTAMFEALAEAMGPDDIQSLLQLPAIQKLPPAAIGLFMTRMTEISKAKAAGLARVDANTTNLNGTGAKGEMEH